jgi:flagellar biosynthesis/type III secretory pathway chaperone
MNLYGSKWLIEQKKIMLDKTISIAQKLQDARKKIAKPYVLALEKQFPNEDFYKLIEIADKDLQKLNEHYRKLTEKLEELAEFNQGPFGELIKMIKQIQP